MGSQRHRSSVKRELADSLCQRDIQLLHRGGVEPAIISEPTTALEALHRVDQGVIVELGNSGCRRLGGKSPTRRKEPHQTRQSRIGLTTLDRFPEHGKLLSVVYAGELHVVNQRCLRTPIAEKGRLKAASTEGISGARRSRSRKNCATSYFFWSTVRLRNVLGIDAPHTEIREITHGADRESNVYLGCFRIRPLQSLLTLIPARIVVVSGFSPLPGLVKKLEHRASLQ